MDLKSRAYIIFMDQALIKELVVAMSLPTMLSFH